MLRIISIVLFFSFYTYSYSQTSIGIATVTIQGEKDIDDHAIEQLAVQLLSDISDSAKLAINEELKHTLKKRID